MDNLLILFWIIAISTFSTFWIALVRLRRASRGWLCISIAILIVLSVAWFQKSDPLVYIGAFMWSLLIAAPSLLARLYHKRLLEQRYTAAHRTARVIACLHPFDGWREQPRIARALRFAQKGNIETALTLLGEMAREPSPVSLIISATVNLYRLTSRWEEFLNRAALQGLDPAKNSALLPVFLRALGEIGDLPGIIQLYEARKAEIDRLSPGSSRDACRLGLFAFCGRADLVERLFVGSLAPMPVNSKAFWLVTAELAAGACPGAGANAGDSLSARRKLASLLEAADPTMRSAIERRLSTPLASASSLGPAGMRLVDQAAKDLHQDQAFGFNAAIPLRHARATQMLIALNLLMFAFEIKQGGATNGEVLYRLGALYPPVVRAGEWWRLGAAMFLHFGALHLAMNMLALWALGPFVERAFRFGRFLLLYLLAGLGSMLFITFRSIGTHADQFTVGASGAIMGIIGATGALMLKGWLRHQAQPAKQRLIRIIIVVGLQTLLDAVIPQVSMAAHLSGAAIGCATGLLLPDKLVTKKRTRAVRSSSG
ncbi:MAG TPA: rhomboid family intramembrane serine protease [Verrucomicrobiae bacterium]|nr:rhomboid family intramembrane serine protease [Verrucomicrobiae bacterium]